jgi:FixJ family two-component response regulator
MPSFDRAKLTPPFRLHYKRERFAVIFLPGHGYIPSAVQLRDGAVDFPE